MFAFTVAGTRPVGVTVIEPVMADTIENTLVPLPAARVSVTCAGAEKPIGKALSGLRTVRIPSDQLRLPKTQAFSAAVVRVSPTVNDALAPGAKVRLDGDTATLQPGKAVVAVKVAAAPVTLVTRRVSVREPTTSAAVSEARLG